VADGWKSPSRKTVSGMRLLFLDLQQEKEEVDWTHVCKALEVQGAQPSLQFVEALRTWKLRNLMGTCVWQYTGILCLMFSSVQAWLDSISTS
jgi:hypothetical protein